MAIVLVAINCWKNRAIYIGTLSVFYAITLHNFVVPTRSVW